MPNPVLRNRKEEEEKRRRRELRLFYRVLGIGMGILLLAVFALNLLLPPRTFSVHEKRMLSQFPEVSRSAVASGEFGDAFEKYASDQMPLRQTFVTLKTTADRLMGIRESQGVYRGKGGWLIQRMEEPDEEILRKTLGDVSDLAGEFPSAYAFVLVPNAVSVYSEKLPVSAVTADQAAFSESVRTGLSGSGIRCLDLSETLLREKGRSREDLYYRTDHHWTTYAAYVSREPVLGLLGREAEGSWTSRTVTEDFVGSLASKSGFSVRKADKICIYTPEDPLNYLVSGPSREGKQASVYSMDGLLSADPYTVFLGGNDGYLHIETDRAGAGSLLVFKDSYFNCFLPFLLNVYETVDVVDPRYYSGDLRGLMYGSHFDQVLFFYDMNTLSEDTSLSLVLSEALLGKEGGQ